MNNTGGMEDEANRSKYTLRQIVLLLAYLLIASYLLPRLNDLPRVLAVIAVSVPVWILYRQSGLRLVFLHAVNNYLCGLVGGEHSGRHFSSIRTRSYWCRDVRILSDVGIGRARENY